MIREIDDITFSGGEAVVIPADGNLITNGTFPENVNGWSYPPELEIDWLDGKALLTQPSSYVNATQNVKVVPGVVYILSADVEDIEIEGRVYMRDGAGNMSSQVRSFRSSIEFTASTENVAVYFGGMAGAGSCRFDNISLISK